MDYYSQASLHRMLSAADQRKSLRKSMRRSVSIGSADHGNIRGHTLDISVNGLSVMIPVALPVDSRCTVHFDVFVDGALVPSVCTGKIAHCSCSGMGRALGLV